MRRSNGRRFALASIYAIGALPAVFYLPLAANAANSAHHPVVTIAIDATANVHAINPRIYGVAFASSDDRIALNAPLNRMGGNGMTTYNWSLNAENLAADWYFESYPQ